MIIRMISPSSKTSITMLFLVITLCMFYLTALARVVSPEVRSQNESLSPGKQPMDTLKHMSLRRSDLEYHQKSAYALLVERNYGVGSHLSSPIAAVLRDQPNSDDTQIQPIEKRADGDQLIWRDSLRTGRKILEEFDKRRKSGSPGYTKLPGGSDEAKRVLENDYEVEEQSLEHDMSDTYISSSLKMDGITTEKGEWVFLHIKEKGKETYFKNSYVYDKQAGAGVIVAENVKRKPDGKLQWSEVAFQQYRQAFPESALADLKYIYRSNIVNYQTTTFMEDSIDRDRPILDTVQTADDEIWWVFRRRSQPESFAGLLGSENGRGAGYLVNDHMEELGKNRGITEIHVSLDATSMKMVLGPIC